MPDAYRLFVLTRLREARGLTLEEMARCCGLPGKRGRETAGRWERGQSIPHHGRRSPFIAYLCKDLGLAHDEKQFDQVFDVLCEEWGWEQLNEVERRRFLSGQEAPLQPVGLGGTIKPRQPTQADARFYVQPDELLFGIEENTIRLLEYLSVQRRRIVSIEGIGGIGKTTLAEHAVRQWIQRGDAPARIVWVSAKQDYLVERGIRPLQGARMQINLDDLFSQVLDKLGVESAHVLDLERKVRQAAEWVKSSDYLIVIDNLESVQDFEGLVPHLTRIPARFLLTSREHLPALSGITSLTLDELSEADSLALITHVVKRRGVTGVFAPQIYALTGGNPLAIYLAVSLMRVIPPEQVLENLRLGSTEAIYQYIYWKAWSALTDCSKRLLFAIQRTGDSATWKWLSRSAGLQEAEIERALQDLTALSLVKTDGLESERRFSIHRLTSTFLCTEVLAWK